MALVFGLHRPPPSPDPSHLSHLTGDEWLAGLYELDAKSLRRLENICADLVGKHPYGVMWQRGLQELRDLFGDEDRLHEAYLAVAAEIRAQTRAIAALRNPQQTSVVLALAYLGLEYRGQLSRKATFGLLQPLLQP